MQVSDKTSPAETVSVCCSDVEQLQKAQLFAQQHGLGLSEPASCGLLLDFDGSGICLRDGKSRVMVDFVGGELAHRKRYGGGRKQVLARAVGIKQGKPLPAIVDATAGLAKDAFVLASLGCEVQMLEQSPIVAMLITDALERACHQPEFQELIDTGFSLQQGDSVELLTEIARSNPPDTVYLDPMYPGRTKTAAVKKNMQLLQRLLGHSDEQPELLEAARACALKRVVVKRPKGANHYAGAEPTTSISSRKTRYDIYL